MSGNLIERINRFVSVVAIAAATGEVEEHSCYMANPGSMLGMCSKGCEVRVSTSTSESRKFRYTVEAVKIGETWIGCNTHIANEIISSVLRSERAPDVLGVRPFESFRREVTRGGSRFDFELTHTENCSTLIEVKTVTMASDWYKVETTSSIANQKLRLLPAEPPAECTHMIESTDKRALFPDCESKRALKHVIGLAELTSKPTRETLLVFVIMRDDIASVGPSYYCDPNYSSGLADAIGKGLTTCAVKCKLNVSDLSDSFIEIVSTVPVEASMISDYPPKVTVKRKRK